MGDRDYVRSGKPAAATRWWMDFPAALYGIVLLDLVFYVFTLPISRADLASSSGVIPNRLLFLSLFQAVFLHLDPIHLTMNLLFLWLFGRKVEAALGSIKFLLFYVGAGFTASLLHVAIAFAFLPVDMQSIPVLGASGAVSGVLGMYAVLFRGDRAGAGRLSLPAALLLFAWLAFQVLMGVFQVASALDGFRRPALGPFDLQYIGYWSHIGGFVFGMAAAWLVAVREAPRRFSSSYGSSRRHALLDAAHRFESLTAAEPDDPFGYAELGRTWALLGDQRRSTANYLKAAELYRTAGDRDEALAVLRDAFRFWPPDTLARDAAFRLICCLETLGEYEEAAGRFASLADSARGEPEGEMALLKLALVELDRLNRPDRAVEALKRLISDHQDSRWAEFARQLLKRAGEGGARHAL